MYISGYKKCLFFGKFSILTEWSPAQPYFEAFFIQTAWKTTNTFDTSWSKLIHCNQCRLHHVNFLLHKIMSYIFSKMIGKIKTIILQLFFTTFHLVFLFTRAQKLYITRCAVLSKKSKDSQAYIIVGLTSTTIKTYNIFSSMLVFCCFHQFFSTCWALSRCKVWKNP